MSESALDFGRRLSLAIKVLNISRGALAVEAMADKSLVSRWARGINAPRGHYLQVLTRIIAARAPAFTQLHWEAPFDSFCRAIGADTGAADASPPGPDTKPKAIAPANRVEWLPLAAEQSRHETIRDGDRYPGIYIQIRHRFGNDRLFADCIPIWRDGDELRVRFDGPFWAHTGRVFILGHQLFMVAEDKAVAEGLWFQIMNGVSGGKAMAMDGVLCTVPHDLFRSPGATMALMVRIEDLDDPEAEPSPARMKAYQQRVYDLSEAGLVAELSGPELIAHVTNRLHQTREDGLVDHHIRAPITRGFTLSSLERHAPIEAAIRRWRRALGEDPTTP